MSGITNDNRKPRPTLRLVGHGSEDNAQMAMARTLSGKIDDNDIQRNWGKVLSGGSKKPRKSALVDPGFIDVIFEGSSMPRPGEPSPLDDLPMEAQLVAETMVDDWEDELDGVVADYDELDEIVAKYSEPKPKPSKELKLVGSTKSKGVSRKELAEALQYIDSLGINVDDFDI